MKILYVITKSEVGGAQTHVADLCRYFVKQGNKVAVMSYPGGWLETEVIRCGAQFFPNKYFSNSLNPFKVLKAFSAAAGAMRDFKPDLVSCHSSAAGIITRLTVRNKIPTIFTAHGWSFNLGVPGWQNFLGVITEKIAARYCAKIIAVCDFVKNLGVNNAVAIAEKFQVVYNGIVVVDSRLSLSNDEFLRIVFAGRLARPKQPLLLLEALSELATDLKKRVILDIYGDGPQRLLLQQRIDEDKLSNVKITSSLYRSEIISKMGKADVLVLPTSYEGFPYVVLEAMSNGLAVVASNVGGIREAVNDDNGWLVENNTVKDWKNILELMLQDLTSVRRKGQRGLIKVNEKFSLENMCSQTAKIYNELLSDKNKVF